jgi:hypothetical protein
MSIISSIYGKNGKYIDVTNIVKSYVFNGTLIVYVSNMIFSDPIKGVKKELRVTMSTGNVITGVEGEWLISDNIDVTTTPKTNVYVFLDMIYDMAIPSQVFYMEMMKKIKNVIISSGHEYKSIKNISEMRQFGENAILVADICIILYLFYPYRQGAVDLFRTKYILIIGENVDTQYNTFMGWSSTSFNFSANNIMSQILRKSMIVTYQNDLFRKLLLTMKRDEEIVYFPIDGYMDEYAINSQSNKDIDVYLYGYITPRRRLIVDNLRSAKINIVTDHNNFNNDNIINRSKIILHVNSIDNCYHIPYAKLMKLLSNNKIVVVEETDELLKSDLCNYVNTFKYEKGCVDLIRNILDNYACEQEKINIKNPKAFIKEKYNFKSNVFMLLKSL